MKQKSMNTTTRKTAVAVAVYMALGIAASPSADAHVYVLRFDGPSQGAFFTMIDPTGAVFRNDAFAYNAPFYGVRTPISGTLTWDTTANGGAGGGSMVIDGFSFGSGGSIASTSNVTLQAIGNGNCTTSGCGAGNLVLGNMGFTWGPNTGIPVPIVWDATGLLAAINSDPQPDAVISGTGVAAASDNTKFGGPTPGNAGSVTWPMGSALPLATTESNTTNSGNTTGCTFPACNPSGTLPLITDTATDTWEDTNTGDKVGVPGSPMPAGPFPGFNANFDFKVLTVLTRDGVGSNTPPAVSGTQPLDGAINVNHAAAVTVSFTKTMKADTVQTAFSLVDVTAGNTPVGGTLAPSGVGQSAFNFTFTPSAPLSYLDSYSATVSTAAQDTNNNFLPTAKTWTFTVQAKPAGQSCASPTADVPLGSNFTMLDNGGTVFGGTNDIVYSLDFSNSNLNTSVTGTTGIMTNTLASDGPQPFFGSPWTAHHIRLFAPGGPYVINTDCTTTQLEHGTCTPNADSSKNITFTVGAGQIGVHMLFNWSGNNDIDVVNVWNQNAQWIDPDNLTAPTKKNDLWTGARWLGPAGFGVDPAVIWDHVSTDADSDGKVGIPMVDGPFIGFNANFNLGPHSSCVATVDTIVMTVDESNARVGGPSCSINSLSNKTLSPLKSGDFWLVAGFLAWLRLVVKRGRKKLARG